MISQNNKIKKVLFDVEYPDKSNTNKAHNEILSMFYSKIERILDKVFDEFFYDKKIQIKKLELDLGNFLIDTVYAEFPQRFEEKLREKMKGLQNSIIFNTYTDNIEIKDDQDDKINYIFAFIESSYIPWNLEYLTEKGNLFDHIIDIFQDYPESAAKFIKKLQTNTTFRNRLIDLLTDSEFNTLLNRFYAHHFSFFSEFFNEIVSIINLTPLKQSKKVNNLISNIFLKIGVSAIYTQKTSSPTTEIASRYFTDYLTEEFSDSGDLFFKSILGLLNGNSIQTLQPKTLEVYQSVIHQYLIKYSYKMYQEISLYNIGKDTNFFEFFKNQDTLQLISNFDEDISKDETFDFEIFADQFFKQWVRTHFQYIEKEIVELYISFAKEVKSEIPHIEKFRIDALIKAVFIETFDKLRDKDFSKTIILDSIPQRISTIFKIDNAEKIKKRVQSSLDAFHKSISKQTIQEVLTKKKPDTAKTIADSQKELKKAESKRKEISENSLTFFDDKTELVLTATDAMSLIEIFTTSGINSLQRIFKKPEQLINKIIVWINKELKQDVVSLILNYQPDLSLSFVVKYKEVLSQKVANELIIRILQNKESEKKEVSLKENIYTRILIEDTDFQIPFIIEFIKKKELPSFIISEIQLPVLQKLLKETIVKKDNLILQIIEDQKLKIEESHFKILERFFTGEFVYVFYERIYKHTVSSEIKEEQITIKKFVQRNKILKEEICDIHEENTEKLLTVAISLLNKFISNLISENEIKVLSIIAEKLINRKSKEFLFILFNKSEADIIKIKKIFKPNHQKIIYTAFVRFKTKYKDSLVKEDENVDKKITDKENMYNIPDITGEYYIDNAGLVILQPYIQALFSKNGLLKGKDFIDESAQSKAILLLEYICRGTTELIEPLVSFNKVLVGIDPHIPIINKGVVLNDKDIELADSLLDAVMNHWTALKNSSRDNLRGSFLLRQGKLYFDENIWRLKIERKAYDILLDKIPWSFTTIKYPWMKNSIFVEW